MFKLFRNTSIRGTARRPGPFGEIKKAPRSRSEAAKAVLAAKLSDARLWSRRVYRQLRTALFYEHWMIGLIEQPISRAPTWKKLPPVHWVEPANIKRCLADAFPWPGSDDTLVCQNIDTVSGRRCLAAVKIDLNGIAAEVDLKLPLTGNLSFPFLFMRDGIVYMMPESAAAGRLEIFRWHEHEGAWVSHAVVFENKPVANAILFEKDGWFWIAYTDLSKDQRGSLNLIYSSRLMGPWRSHSSNPVQTGRGASRNGGGVFVVDGRLYRPARDFSDPLGVSLRIMEIVTCTPLAYQEREVTRMTPSSTYYPDGCRTLTAWGDQCLVDGVKLTFAPRLLWERLKNRFHR